MIKPSSCKSGTPRARRASALSLVRTSEGELNSAIGALVVFDVTCRESFDNVNKWLEEITLNTSSNIAMVLVGNKVDRKEELVNKS